MGDCRLAVTPNNDQTYKLIIPRTECCATHFFCTQACHPGLSRAPGPACPIPYNNGFMKARIYVSLKPTVLDPQGQTICSALNGMGHRSIASVRQGKYFEVTIEGGDPTAAEAELNRIAQDVLANPVIEDYWVELLD
jgi:phosphoribosylformylglycinamidine synthase subunit PurS